MTVPDEAVRAACDYLRDLPIEDDGRSFEDDVRAALAAALPHLNTLARRNVVEFWEAAHGFKYQGLLGDVTPTSGHYSEALRVARENSARVRELKRTIAHHNEDRDSWACWDIDPDLVPSDWEPRR